MFSPYLKNGVVVQVAAVAEFPTASAFRDAIRSLRFDFGLHSTPSIRFRSLRGRDLEVRYGRAPKVDGKPIDYEQWPLFGGPFLQADVDSERLVLKHGPSRRTLDFKTLTVSDSEER